MNKRKSPRSTISQTASRSIASRSAALAGVSFALVGIVLTGVYFWPDFSEPLSDENKKAGNSNPLSDRSSGEPTRSQVPLPSIVLPTEPIAFETKEEQERLLACLDIGLRDFPNDAQLLHAAALTYGELLQTEKAISYFDRALVVDPRNLDVIVRRGDLLRQVGRDDDVCRDLRKAYDDGMDALPLLTALGNAYTQVGQPEDAQEILEKGLTRFPKDGALRLSLAQAQLQLEKFDAAEENARAAISLGNTDRATYLVLSTALLRRGASEEAQTIRSKMAPTSTPEKQTDEKYHDSFRGFASHTYEMIAGVYASHNRSQNASEALTRSLELDPKSIVGTTMLADLCRRNGRLKDCVLVQERLIQLQPDNPFNYTNLASLLVATGDVVSAERVLRNGARVDSIGFVNMQLARFLLATDRSQEAAKFAKQAVDKQGNVDAYLLWISALKANGDMASAMAAYKQAIKIAPNDPQLTQFKF